MLHITKIVILATTVALVPRAAGAQGTSDSVSVLTSVRQILSDSSQSKPIRIVRTYAELLQRFGRCQGDSVGANCRLKVPGPVFMISGIRFEGDSSLVYITTFQESTSRGIMGMRRTWVMRPVGPHWRKVRILEAETITM